MRATSLAVVVLLLLGACSLNSTPSPASNARPTPTSARCSGDDHLLDLQQLGWSFCYPSTWKFRERDVQTTAPAGVDTTLDIVGDQGLFGFMIIGSYERKGAGSLKDWLAANEPDDTDVTPIHWGNATEAVQVNGQLRRYAMSKSRVYLLSEREGQGNLDLEAEMSKRLANWYFAF